MKINDIVILVEGLDPKEVQKTFASLNRYDPVLAKLFWSASASGAHDTIDSAVSAASTERAKIGLAKAQQKQQASASKSAERKPRTRKLDYSDRFRGNQYVKIKKKELPPELQRFLPILNKGLATAITSGFSAGKRLADLAK